MFPSLSPSLPLSLKINKIFFKEEIRSQLSIKNVSECYRFLEAESVEDPDATLASFFFLLNLRIPES